MAGLIVILPADVRMTCHGLWLPLPLADGFMSLEFGVLQQALIELHMGMVC